MTIIFILGNAEYKHNQVHVILFQLLLTLIKIFAKKLSCHTCV